MYGYTNSRSRHELLKRQAMYYNITFRRSRNHCWSGKKISIAYSVSVFVALGIQYEIRMPHIVICDLPGFTTFFHIIL